MQIGLKPSEIKFDSEGKFHWDMKVIQLGEKSLWCLVQTRQTNMIIKSTSAGEVGVGSNHSLLLLA